MPDTDAAFNAPVPYAEIDRPVRALCRALNAFPGLHTTGSCGGHDNPQPGQWPAGQWVTTLKVRSDADGWFALEFLAWAVNAQVLSEDRPVLLYPYATEPWLTGPGEALRFHLEGSCDADDLAAFIADMRKQRYIPPRGAA